MEGGHPLRGTIQVGGAKNAALKLMAASLLTPEPCILQNVPDIRDVRTMERLLAGLGATVERLGDRLTIRAETLRSEAPEEPVREMRASIQVLGPMVARTGRLRIAQPGGCSLGPRPIDLHLQGLIAMGAQVEEEHGVLTVTAPKGLHGAEIHLDFPSVGATENLMMAAALARGRTVIANAAREPEIADSVAFLNQCGARARGVGTDVIEVEGVAELHGTTYQVMPDRIEAATYALMVAAAGGDLLIRPVRTEHLGAVLGKMTEMGVDWAPAGDGLRVRGKGAVAEHYQAVHVRALPYPGFPTDVQPQIMAVLTMAHGTSVISEEVHASRFRQVGELRRMGAWIWTEGRTAVIRGPVRLTGARAEIPDLRAGAALLTAALAAEGNSWLEGVEHLDRGYAALEGRLTEIGAAVSRITEDKEE